MAEAKHHYQYHQRRRLLKDFERKAKELLSESDRKYLYGVLKDYQMHRQVELLISSLQVALDTPAKMDLFLNIRHFLPSAHQLRYDRLVPYHKMAAAARVDSLDELFQQGPGPPPSVLDSNGDSASMIYGSLGKLQAQRYLSEPNLNGTMSLGRHPWVNGSPSSGKHHGSTPHLVRQTQAGQTYVTGSAELEERGPIKTLMLVREPDENLGFSVRGGSEHGLGIYVSELMEGSAGDVAGLMPGDHILEVNSIRFENIASSSAVKVLTGTTKLRITIKRAGKIPGFKFAREKTSWYDTNEGEMVEGAVEDHGTFHYPAGLSFVDGIIERRVHLSITKEGTFLGFNIRGGSEYGLGIYVSKIDHGGMAEQKGLKVGDQIVAVNGQSLENLTHGAAVDILRNHKTLVLTVREVGKFPAFKEIYAEYSWIDTSTGSVTRSPFTIIDPEGRPKRSGLITSIPVMPSPMEQPIEDHYRYSGDLYDNTDNHSSPQYNSRSSTRLTNGGVEPEEEQTREMNFPDDACLTVPLPSDSPTISDDRESDPDPSTVINELDTMLIPHSSDIILQERSLHEKPTEDITKAKEKGRKKDKDNPRSKLGIYALQLENMPEDVKQMSKSQRNRIQSLRKPGDINPRQFEDIELNVKKTRTFREMLFGTKSRKKLEGQVPVKPRNKSRQPLTNLGFTDPNKDTQSLAASLDLNLEATPKPATFVRGLGSQIMLHDSVNQIGSAPRLSEQARELLTEDEVLAVNRHLARYETQGDVKALVIPLLAIFDTPGKLTILSEVRTTIRTGDLERFESMISAKQTETSEQSVTDTSTGKLTAQRESQAAPHNSISGTNINIKVSKNGQYKTKQDQTDHVDHRERLARLAQEKRQSLTEVETIPPANNTTSTPKDILDILTPRGNSRVYKAVKPSSPRGGNNNIQSANSSAHLPQSTFVSVKERTEVYQREAQSNRRVSPVSSRRSSASSTGVHGVYSLTEQVNSDWTPTAVHPDLYSVTHVHMKNESNLNDSVGSSDSQTHVSQVTQYRTAEQSQGENVVMLVSSKNLQEHNKRTLTSSREDLSIKAALEAIESLDDIEDIEHSPQISPRSVASVSTIASTRFGSYDVTHPDSDVTTEEPTSPRVPPVFIPPPPPLEPPPANHGDEVEVVDVEEEEGWSEWVTEDVTEEVMTSTSIGLSTRTSAATIMRDKAVGQTPQYSPQGSMDSLRDSTDSGDTKTENKSNSNSNDVTLDFFTGSLNESHVLASKTNSENNELSNFFADSDSGKGSLHRGAVRSLAQVTSGGNSQSQSSLPQQVNSLRDTLKARRKSAERPRLSAEAFVFPEHLLVPEWGRMSQADNQQEEVVVDHQTVAYSDPGREPTHSPPMESQKLPDSPQIYSESLPNFPNLDPENLPGSTEELIDELLKPPGEYTYGRHQADRKTMSPDPVYSVQEQRTKTQYQTSKMSSMERNLHKETHTDDRIYIHSNSDSMRVSVEEVESFMSNSECRGDQYLRQEQALDSVIYSQPQETTEFTVEEPTLVILPKGSSSLGMSISGGRNSRTQPQVKIQKVNAGGAAAAVGLKAGMRLISIDGQSLANVTHPQAVEMIRRSYTNKKHPDMELLILP